MQFNHERNQVAVPCLRERDRSADAMRGVHDIGISEEEVVWGKSTRVLHALR